MERISEEDDRDYIFKFGLIWLGFFMLIYIASGLNWIFLPFLLFGFPFIIYHLIKMREIHIEGSSIKIKNKNDYIDVPIKNIKKIEKFAFVAGCHRLSFKEKTKLGNYILFIPRGKKLFGKHEAYKQLLKQVNP